MSGGKRRAATLPGAIPIKSASKRILVAQEIGTHVFGPCVECVLAWFAVLKVRHEGQVDRLVLDFGELFMAEHAFLQVDVHGRDCRGRVT